MGMKMWFGLLLGGGKDPVVINLEGWGERKKES